MPEQFLSPWQSGRQRKNQGLPAREAAGQLASQPARSLWKDLHIRAAIIWAVWSVLSQSGAKAHRREQGQIRKSSRPAARVRLSAPTAAVNLGYNAAGKFQNYDIRPICK